MKYCLTLAFFCFSIAVYAQSNKKLIRQVKKRENLLTRPFRDLSSTKSYQVTLRNQEDQATIKAVAAILGGYASSISLLHKKSIAKQEVTLSSLKKMWKKHGEKIKLGGLGLSIASLIDGAYQFYLISEKRETGVFPTHDATMFYHSEMVKHIYLELAKNDTGPTATEASAKNKSDRANKRPHPLAAPTTPQGKTAKGK